MLFKYIIILVFLLQCKEMLLIVVVFFLKFFLKTPFQGVSLKGPYTGYWKTRKSRKEKAMGTGTNREKKEKTN